MPINFMPAAPVAPEINARFGAADQYNRIYPQLAELYASAGRNITQASAQTAQNFTQGNIASAENQTRRTLQGFQIDAEEMQQRRQIEAQREAQMRQIQAQQQAQAQEQRFEMDRMMLPISRQEQLESTRRIDGLAEIERQLEEQIITPEQAGDARYQLLTKEKAFQNRKSYQDQQLAKAKEAQINQEMANITKAQAAQEDFYLKLAANGVTIQDVLDSSTGKTRPLAYDPTTKKLYNPFLEHSGKEEKPQEYDWGKALKDAKAEAEAAYPVQKDKDEEIRVSKERNDYVQQIMERDRHKQTKPQSAVPGLPAPQAVQSPSAPQPVQQPVQQFPPEVEFRLTALKAQYPDPSKAPPEVQQEIKALLAMRRK